MNTRIHVSGLVLLLVYHLAIAAVVTYFMVHCETATGAVFGDRMSAPPRYAGADLDQPIRMNASTTLRGNGHRMTRIAEDSDAVFAKAIDWGVLSEDAGDANFAGHYMYMFHDADDAVWFKHRDTRAYVTMGVAPSKGLAPGKRVAPGKGTAAGNGAVEREAGQP